MLSCVKYEKKFYNLGVWVYRRIWIFTVLIYPETPFLIDTDGKSTFLMLNILGTNFSRRHFEIFDISCKLSLLETFCKWQSLFSGKSKENIIKLSSAETGQRVVEVTSVHLNGSSKISR